MDAINLVFSDRLRPLFGIELWFSLQCHSPLNSTNAMVMISGYTGAYVNDVWCLSLPSKRLHPSHLPLSSFAQFTSPHSSEPSRAESSYCSFFILFYFIFYIRLPLLLLCLFCCSHFFHLSHFVYYFHFDLLLVFFFFVIALFIVSAPLFVGLSGFLPRFNFVDFLSFMLAAG